jgi:hypothetical protein
MKHLEVMVNMVRNKVREQVEYSSITFVELIVVFVILCIMAGLLVGILVGKAEGGDLDDHIRSSLFGVWKELHHQDCLDGESIVIYYPHMQFEEFTIYIANEDCEFIKTGDVVKAGEVTYRTVSGVWEVVDGYIHYTTDLGKEVTILKVLSMGTKQANFSWGNGNTLQGYKIGGIQ